MGIVQLNSSRKHGLLASPMTLSMRLQRLCDECIFISSASQHDILRNLPLAALVTTAGHTDGGVVSLVPTAVPQSHQ
jgi:hypothetical protein